MTKTSHIHLVITGGTIDSVFDGTLDTTVVNDSSVIQDYLTKMIRPHFKITQEIVTLKDSRAITDHTRADVVKAIQAAPSNYIIVTHGTYTMPNTASYLTERVGEIQGKTVVLTGAYYPLKNFAESDASFNLGFACAMVLTQNPGVYLAMNGKLFSGGAVLKNIETRRFEDK